MAAGDRQQNSKDGASIGGLMGLTVLPLLCCGMPVLPGALDLTMIGAFLAASRYQVLGGFVVLFSVVIFFAARRGDRTGMNSSCVVSPPQDATPKGER